VRKHAVWAIPAVFAAAAAISWALLARAPAHVAVDLRQPLVVATNWGAYGAAFLAVLFGALAVASIAYVAALQHETLRLSTVLTACAAALACAWAMPVLFSSDVYAYATYGELARLGADPYGHAALPAGNPLFAAAIWQWGNPPPACVYGPLFVALCGQVLALLHGFGVAAQLDGLRLLASLALIACGALAFAAYRGTHAQRTLAAATIALNPAAIWCCAEGHNDAIALAIVLAGYALAAGGRFAAGAIVAALSATVKLPGIAAAVPFLWENGRARIGALLGIAAALGLAAPQLQRAALHVVPHGTYAPQASFQAVVLPLARLMVPGDTAATVAAWLLAFVLALLCAVRGAVLIESGQAEGWLHAALGAWLLVPNPYPWYAVWLLPMAALAPRSRAAAVALALSFTALLRYVPDAAGAPGPLGSALLGVAATLPLVGLLGKP
jgi:hypothetical protein